MNRKLIFALAIILLALDWAALHDIVKQNQPTYRAEWLMVSISLPLFAFLVWKWKCTSTVR
jgi:hypothetical protein